MQSDIVAIRTESLLICEFDRPHHILGDFMKTPPIRSSRRQRTWFVEFQMPRKWHLPRAEPLESTETDRAGHRLAHRQHDAHSMTVEGVDDNLNIKQLAVAMAGVHHVLARRRLRRTLTSLTGWVAVLDGLFTVTLHRLGGEQSGHTSHLKRDRRIS